MVKEVLQLSITFVLLVFFLTSCTQGPTGAQVAELTETFSVRAGELLVVSLQGFEQNETLVLNGDLAHAALNNTALTIYYPPQNFNQESTFTITSSTGKSQTVHISILASAPAAQTTRTTASRSVSDVLSANAGSDSSICSGSTLALNGLATGGTEPYNYSWTGPNSFTSSSQNSTISSCTVNCAGTYTLNVTDNVGNTSVDTMVATVNSAPTASAGGSATICQTGSYALFGGEASSTNGAILWTENGAGSITAGATTLTPTYTAAAGDAGNTVTLTMTVSNDGCADATATYSVVVDAIPTTAVAGPDQTIAATCGLTSATLAANTPIIGTGSWSIVSGAGGSFVDASDPTTVFSGTAGTTYVLRWTISNAPCTASSDDITIIFNQTPITANTTLTSNISATGTCITFGANNIVLDCAGYKITWDTGGGGSDSAILATSVNNITVKNCVLVDGNSSGTTGIGIYFTTVTNSTIQNNTIQTNGTDSSHGIRLEISANKNTITNNSIRTDGTSSNNYGIHLFATVSGNNVTGNRITTNGTNNNHGIRLQSSADNNTFHTNFITTLSNLSYGISLLDSSDNSFNGTTLNATTEWIHSGIGMLNNFSNTTFQTGNGSINSTPLWTLTGLQNITQLLLNITNNTAFVNTSNLTMLNTTAQVKLNGITLTTPNVFSSTEDSEPYSLCSSPTCVNQSYTGGVFTFNVTHFTTYRASENLLTGSVSGFNTNVVQTGNTSNVTLVGTVNISFSLGSGETVNLSSTEVNTTTGLTVISNLTLPAGITKSVQVIVAAGTSQLCIVDQADASNIQPDCINGLIIICPGNTETYTCSVSGTIATVTGLTHTAVGSFGSANRGGTRGISNGIGSGVPEKQYVVQTATMNGQTGTYALQKKDNVVLYIHNQKHILTVFALTMGSVTLQADNTELILKKYQSTNIDLNNDWINDLHIRVVEIEKTRVHLELAKLQTTQAVNRPAQTPTIQKPKQPTQPTLEKPASVKLTPLPSPRLPSDNTQHNQNFVTLLLVLAVVLSIGLFVKLAFFGKPKIPTAHLHWLGHPPICKRYGRRK